MFTIPCYIKIETNQQRREVVEWLEKIGKECVFIKKPESNYISSKYEYYNIVDDGDMPSYYFDCGSNTELFKAVSALRDDNDKNQWFICNTALSDSGFVKGEFWLSRVNEFDTTFCNGTTWRKANISELQEHFKL